MRRVEIPCSEDYVAQVAAAVRQGHLAAGPAATEFAHRFGEYVGASDCALVSNGFAALLLTLKALGLSGRRVLVPAASTCFAITNAVLASGNVPVGCDLDEATFGLAPQAARALQKDVGFEAIISPNHFGVPSDVDALRELGVPVIEDAAQSILTTHRRGCRGDATVFSFYPTKALNAVDGGAVVSRDARVVEAVRSLGRYDQQRAADGVPRFNMRMPDLHAVVGLVSLARLPDTAKKLGELQARFRESRQLSRVIPPPLLAPDHVPWRMLFRERDAVKRARLAAALAARDVESGPELIVTAPMETASAGARLCEAFLSLPFHEKMTTADVQLLEEVFDECAERPAR